MNISACKGVVTYSELRQDQNTLKGFLRVDEEKPSIEEQKPTESEKEPWFEPILCEGHNKSIQPTVKASVD